MNEEFVEMPDDENYVAMLPLWRQLLAFQAISLNLSPKRASNLVSRSESFTVVLARRETVKSFFVASAAEADVRQTAIV